MRLSYPAAIRQWFILGLLVSNLALGGLSYTLLRELDTQYSNLLDRSIPILAKRHGISVNLIRSRRAMLDSLAAKTDAERALLLDRAAHFEQESAKLRLNYQHSPDVVNGQDLDAEIEAVARDYRKGMEQFIALVHAGRAVEAAELRTNGLRQVVDHYDDVIERRVTQIEARAEQINQTYTQGNGFRAKMVLLLASWPVVATLAITCVLVITFLALLAAVLKPAFTSRKSAS